MTTEQVHAELKALADPPEDTSESYPIVFDDMNGWQLDRPCDYCGNPISAKEDFHTPHELECNRLGCQCDLVTHPACCEEGGYCTDRNAWGPTDIADAVYDAHTEEVNQ